MNIRGFHITEKKRLYITYLELETSGINKPKFHLKFFPFFICKQKNHTRFISNMILNKFVSILGKYFQVENLFYL